MMQRYSKSSLSTEEYAELRHEQEILGQEWDAAQDKFAQDVHQYKAASWTARSGQRIQVYVWGKSITVEVDSESHDDCQFGSVPPAQAAAAKALGIVAKLGPVGVTAAQKKAIEAKIR